MLIALMTLLFLGGGSSTAVFDFVTETQPAVKASVDDDERRRAAVETVKEMKALAKGQSKALQKAVKELKPYVGDLDADDAKLEAFWQSYFDRARTADEQMLDLRFKLRDQLTREEWQQVFGQPGS